MSMHDHEVWDESIYGEYNVNHMYTGNVMQLTLDALDKKNK